MLVLTRKIGESFFIGDHGEITVKVLTNDGRQVRIGIDAPREVLVSRAEWKPKHSDAFKPDYSEQ